MQDSRSELNSSGRPYILSHGNQSLDNQQISVEGQTVSASPVLDERDSVNVYWHEHLQHLSMQSQHDLTARLDRFGFEVFVVKAPMD